jgi:hypothetical protein
MEPNLRDTPLRRFNTFFWGLGLFVVFGLACLIIKYFIQEDKMFSVDDDRGKARVLKREQVEVAQAALLDFKKDGDSVQVPPSALFSLAGELLETQPSDSGIPHNYLYGEPAKVEESPAAVETPKTEEKSTTE